MIERGDILEYTDEYQRDYTLGDPDLARYAVACENENKHCEKLLVEDEHGSKYVYTHCIVASAWVGWVPDRLEEVWERYQNEKYGDDLYHDYY